MACVLLRCIAKYRHADGYYGDGVQDAEQVAARVGHIRPLWRWKGWGNVGAIACAAAALADLRHGVQWVKVFLKGGPW